MAPPVPNGVSRSAKIMSWADAYIEKLKAGETVSFRPRGKSMEPRIKDGQKVTVSPASVQSLSKGDVVLCQVGKKQYLHLIKDFKSDRSQFLIGNNRGRINGWIGADKIYGKQG